MTAPVQLTVHGQAVRLAAPALPRPASLPVAHQPVLPLAGCEPSPVEQGAGREEAFTTADLAARSLVARVATSLLEVLQQRRGGSQLGMWMGEDAHAVLMAWARRGGWQQAAVVGVRACCPAPRVVEGSLHLRTAGGDVAAALRLEHGYGRWRIVAFDVLAPAVAVRHAA